MFITSIKSRRFYNRHKLDLQCTAALVSVMFTVSAILYGLSKSGALDW